MWVTAGKLQAEEQPLETFRNSSIVIDSERVIFCEYSF